MKLKRPIAATLALILGISLLSLAPQPDEALAADASQFDPGNIISDALFYDGNAMGSAEIQSFLIAKEPACRSTYACMWNYGQTTPAMPARTGVCAAISATGGMNAANIVFTVGNACGISQKVLLVLLQKEQGLVASNNPSAASFKYATGFGCPDSSGCDASFGGFFYQVYYAARQFKLYNTSSASFNFQAGRVNNILYSPNCSTRVPVFIQNKATAGLYDYTPYTPNAAAMGNLYGMGDDCSAYGNRNFWAYYTDWFGSTTLGTSLIRTSADQTVYLVSGAVKYPVTSNGIFVALFPLGTVATVSQTYMDSFTLGHPVGRSLRGPDGSIYFFDAGIILPFASCSQVADYGASCDPSGYVQLTAAQIASFYPGPPVGPILGTSSGARFYITGGTKREILDDQSQASAGLPQSMNVLSDNAVSDLPYGVPIIRDSAFAQTRGTSTVAYLQGGAQYPVAGDPGQMGVTTRVSGTLSAASFAKIAVGAGSFTGIVTAPGATQTQFLSASGRLIWPTGVGGYAPVSAFAASQSLVDSYPLSGTIGIGSFVKTASSASVYVVAADSIKPIASWPSLLSLSPTATPVILSVPDSAIAASRQGLVALTAGSLVKSPNSATIYLVNGLTDKIPVSSFIMTNAAGITGYATFDDGLVQAYPSNPRNLGFGYACGPINYVAANGSIHPITPAFLVRFPIPFIALDSYTCAQMKIGSTATQFIRTMDGSIYWLDESGQKMPITSMQKYNALNGPNVGYLQVDYLFAASIPTGPAI